MSDLDLPYMAEYAKSGRSSCKQCKESIGKDTLRIGVMVQAPKFDGKIPLWHHVRCFFLKKQLQSTGDMKNFASLRYEDQQKIKANVGGTVEVKPKGRGAAAKGSKKKKLEAADPSVIDFSVEYAKSSRSACKLCDEKIEKNQVRISKADTESEKAIRFGPLPAWHHLDCFAKIRIVLGYTKSAEALPGFSTLSQEDKDILMQKIPDTSSNDNNRKRKLPSEAPVPAKVAKHDAEEKALKAQSQLFFSFRDKLQKNLTKKELSELLEENSQELPSGESALLDRLADCLTFGATVPCPECKGQLKVGSYLYKCTGNLTSWTKCQYTVKTPKRKKFAVSEEFKEKYDFLKSYKYVERNRIFPSNPDAPSSQSRPSTSNGSLKPLENFKIAFVGELKRGNEEAEKIVTNLGGKVSKRIDKTTTCILTTKDEAEKNKVKVDSAKLKSIFVIAEEFLDEVKDGGAAHLIKKHMLYPWGGDPVEKLCNEKNARYNKSIVKQTSKSESKIQKMVVHGKAAVDPESGLEDEAHVLELKGVIYNVVLGMVDIQRGTNSYYKLQILKHNHHSKYYIFRAWGRVGTTIGGNKLEKISTPLEAISQFEELYLDKTGNDWSCRDNFVKHPNRFYPLDIDYGQDAVKTMKHLKPGHNSKLSRAIQELICLIFDVQAMENAMLEFEIDLQKMPLGKLSKKQIQSAYRVLTELQEILKSKKNETKVLDASNRFYTLIPHDFGMKKPPMLDCEAALKTKTEMLDSLLEIELAYTLLTGGQSDKEDPIDQHYLQLKTDIEVLEKTSKEFCLLADYLKNTHADTHRQYSLHIEEIFKINRQGEAARYEKKSKPLTNKKLLWHGSRTTNFAGILSQGLRIAPPEAPTTGYMFGKGVYFADMVSKSANYCFASQSNPKGILLLCEVALGNMYERENAEFITKLPTNYHSTKGLGQTSPDPKNSVIENGIEVPLGKPIKDNKQRRTLLYNEYIVYDVNQINIKYLLKVNFKW